MPSRSRHATKKFSVCWRKDAVTKKSPDTSTSAHEPSNSICGAVFESRNYSRPQASQTGNRHVCKRAGGTMQPRDQSTQKEIQVATLVWEGLPRYRQSNWDKRTGGEE